jgi:hypothetical protein
METTPTLQEVVEQAMTTPEVTTPEMGERKPTAKEIADYKKTLKENTELLELEARNWKAQYESLTYRIELGKLNASLAKPETTPSN